MAYKRIEVPHVWQTKVTAEGYDGVCLRCGWKVKAIDSDDYKDALDAAKTQNPCTISERTNHEIYLSIGGSAAAWVCHHCGLTSDEGEKSRPCIYPNPEKEKEWKVHEKHTWSYSDTPSKCVCSCESCGHTVTAASRSASVLLTAREDKNVPCTVKVEEEGTVKKTVFNREDPEYGQKCAEILEGLIHLQELMDDESQSLTVTALHEKSFNTLFAEGRDLVKKYTP